MIHWKPIELVSGAWKTTEPNKNQIFDSYKAKFGWAIILNLPQQQNQQQNLPQGQS